jgi:hypothetical protein
MAKRKGISKGLRFDIFKRDGFTCQYCGRQPPEVILHLDHITPIARSGTNDEMNLVTSCAECNMGKGKKLLDRPQCPDADLAWLETQQEIAELRRYQAAKVERDRLTDEIVELLKSTWHLNSNLEWYPADHLIRQMIEKYDAGLVERAFVIVGPKVASSHVDERYERWLQYTWGVLRKLAEQEDG